MCSRLTLFIKNESFHSSVHLHWELEHFEHILFYNYVLVTKIMISGQGLATQIKR